MKRLYVTKMFKKAWNLSEFVILFLQGNHVSTSSAPIDMTCRTKQLFCYVEIINFEPPVANSNIQCISDFANTCFSICKAISQILNSIHSFSTLLPWQ